MYKHDDRVVLVLGGSSSSGGMFAYLQCWINELSSRDIPFMVLASRDVVSKLENAEWGVALAFNFEEISAKRLYVQAILHRTKLITNSGMLKIGKFKPTVIHFVDETLLFPFYRKLMSGLAPEIVITVHDPVYHKGQFRSVFTRIAALYSRMTYFLSPRLTLHLHGERSLSRWCMPKYFSRRTIYPHPLPRTIEVKSVKFENEILVGFVGRIEPYKGIDLFVQAIQVLAKRYSNIKGLIVGRGDLPENLLNLDNTKIIVDNTFVSDQSFHGYVSSLDLLVLPYREATQSGVGYLAKAYGVPIVSTPVGDLVDLIDGHPGVLVTSITGDGVAEAILKAVGAYVKKKLIENNG